MDNAILKHRFRSLSSSPKYNTLYKPIITSFLNKSTLLNKSKTTIPFILQYSLSIQSNHPPMAAISKSHRYLGRGDLLTPSSYTDHFEFDESDLWTSAEKPESSKKPVSNPRPIRKPVRKSLNVDPAHEGPRSLPMNIPDWSKILRSEYRPRASVFGDEFEYDDDDDDDEDVNGRMPPHEYLARKRVASFSVHEGVGRTLKGRDLSRVRNAIWKKTGFED